MVGIIGMAFMVAGTRTRTFRPVGYPVLEAKVDSSAESRRGLGSA